VVLVHAVRHARELVYRDLIRKISTERPQLHTVTFVSREQAAGSLAGRIPAAMRDGRLEKAAGVTIDQRSHVMLCGNPEMLKDATAALLERGLRKHRRRTPGHITVESFW
jgi:ferredoxin--NADP+ reductase